MSIGSPWPARSRRALTRSLADFLLGCVAADGTIREFTDVRNLRPYKANLAAAGLADASRLTDDPRYLAAAWTWLDGYAARMDPVTGFVVDADLVAGVLVGTGDADSTDSYAGTFLVALKAAWLAGRDSSRLATFAGSIALALTAVEQTLDDDGLTYCKPTYPAKFLMDQVETVAGLHAGIFLSEILDEPVMRDNFTATAAIMLAGIEQTLWDRQAGSYVWALHGDGTRIATDFSDRLHALQNVWAVAWGVAGGARADRIMARFDGLHSGWDLSSDIYYGIPIWASQRVNDEARADEALFNVAHTAWAHDRRWPFDALAAGTLLLACTMGGIRHYGTAPPTGGGRRRQVPFSPPG